MRFSFVIIAITALASASNAAVIPRANVNAGLAARYHAGRVFSRETYAESPNVARADVAEELNERNHERNHPRDFHIKRAGAPPQSGDEGVKVKRAPEVVNRRVHARDFRLERMVV